MKRMSGAIPCDNCWNPIGCAKAQECKIQALADEAERGYDVMSEHHLKPWTLLPPATGCPECGRAHAGEQPHDAQQLVYQYAFYDRHGRWPTWADAMAHCTEAVQILWAEKLAEFGVDIHSTKVNGS